MQVQQLMEKLKAKEFLIEDDEHFTILSALEYDVIIAALKQIAELRSIIAEQDKTIALLTAVKQSDIDAAKEYADSKFAGLSFDNLTAYSKKLWYSYYNGYLAGRHSKQPAIINAEPSKA